MISELRNLEEFNGKFAGKTCFILGAGCSLINQLDDLHKLSNHITIAVNSGYVAYPASDFFISDDWSSASWSYFWRDLVESKTTTALLYDQKLTKSAPLFGSRAVMFKHRKGYNLTSVYSHTNREQYSWEARSSAGSAIGVAHIMGCEHIVLLGVDGRRVGDYRYFWQMPQWKGQKPYRNDNIKIDAFKRCEVQKIPTDIDLKSINDYWKMIGQKSPLKIYNASPISIIQGMKTIPLSDAIEERFGG